MGINYLQECEVQHYQIDHIFGKLQDELLGEQKGTDITHQRNSKFRKTGSHKKVILHALRKVKITACLKPTGLWEITI